MNVVYHPSPNFENRPSEISVDMLVLHYTGMASSELALRRLCDLASKVSAHYLIDEEGVLYQLVDEEVQAWHAGRSSWRGHTNINSRSIGIELVNPGHKLGYKPYSKAQMDSVISLALDIIARHPISPRNIVGHSDIAPARKQDPGELFDWQQLASAGIGLWPEPMEGVVGDIKNMLTNYGYDSTQEGFLIAFQRHFEPDNVTGLAAPKTMAIAAGLLRLID